MDTMKCVMFGFTILNNNVLGLVQSSRLNQIFRADYRV